MSQDLRDMLSNRRFAIPLIVLLAFCFVGLILVGIVLILRPGAPQDGEPVAQATSTVPTEATELPTSTRAPTDSPTPRSSPTLVPVGTEVSSGSGGTPVSSVGGEATATESVATAEPPSTESAAAEATATPPTDEELADTGVGWGLIIFSGIGLALLVLVARRLRLAH
jgi:hypothetical protein